MEDPATSHQNMDRLRKVLVLADKDLLYPKLFLMVLMVKVPM